MNNHMRGDKMADARFFSLTELLMSRLYIVAMLI